MDPSVQPVAKAVTTTVGSRDGVGAGDHDEPFTFGRRPSSTWTYPFAARQFARLLVLRGKVRDGEIAGDGATG